MSDPAESVTALLKALPGLQESVARLKEETWAKTKEELSTLERAKMDVFLAYAINDLIWVYLKLQGVDPATHPVSKELERIKKYYSKIRSAEEGDKNRLRVDKDAAHRFVLNSIPKSQRLNPAGPSSSKRPSTRDDTPEIGTSGDTSFAGRFRFIAKDDETEKIRPEEESIGEMDVDVDMEEGQGLEGDDAQKSQDSEEEDEG